MIFFGTSRATKGEQNCVTPNPKKQKLIAAKCQQSCFKILELEERFKCMQLNTEWISKNSRTLYWSYISPEP